MCCNCRFVAINKIVGAMITCLLILYVIYPVSEQVERIAEADLMLQTQYMAKKPKKIDIYKDKDFQLELEDIQREKIGRRRISAAAPHTKKITQHRTSVADGLQQQSSIEGDKSKERYGKSPPFVTVPIFVVFLY